MNRIKAAIAGLGVLAAIALPLTPAATAHTADPTSPAAAAVSQRHFTATGTLGRYYTKQTVTGVYRNAVGRPINVSLLDWQGNVVLVKAFPVLDNTWWGGYWKTTYGLDQWKLGRASGTTYHLMLPPPPMGSTFTALLVSEFGPDGANGNWQNWMSGTST